MAEEVKKPELSESLKKAGYRMADGYNPGEYEKGGVRINTTTATPAMADKFIALGAKVILKEDSKVEATKKV